MEWSHILLMLAVARLARLVTADRVFQRVRDLVAGQERDELGNPLRPPSRPLAAYFIECPWCTSIYLATPITAAVLIWPDSTLVLAVLLILSASLVAGLMAQLEELLDAWSERARGLDL